MRFIKDIVIAYKWEQLHRRIAAMSGHPVPAASSWSAWAIVLALVLSAFGAGCLVGSAATESNRPAASYPEPELVISIFPTAVTASIQNEGASHEQR